MIQKNESRISRQNKDDERLRISRQNKHDVYSSIEMQIIHQKLKQIINKQKKIMMTIVLCDFEEERKYQ